MSLSWSMRLSRRWGAAIVGVAIIVALSVAAELMAVDQPTASNDDSFHLPGGGVLRVQRDAEGDVRVVDFSGTEDWLLRSNDVQSKWDQLPRLTDVHLSTTDVTTPMLSYIASLPHLKVFSITGETALPGDSLAPLARMKNLNSLEISDNRIGEVEVRPEHWSFITGLESLRHLMLFSPSLAKTELNFPVPSHLESLDLVGVSAETARNVRELAKLQWGRFDEIEDPSVLIESLCRLQRMRFLTLGRVELKRTDFDRLATLRGLVQLSISFKTLPTINFLASMEQLEDLDFDFDTVDASVVDERQIVLKKLRKLRMVTRDSRGIEVLRHLVGTVSLEYVSYVAAYPEPLSLDPIRNHPSIKELRFDEELTMEHLDALASLPKLGVLVVRNVRASRWFQAAKARLPGVAIYSAAARSEGGDGASLRPQGWLPEVQLTR